MLKDGLTAGAEQLYLNYQRYKAGDTKALDEAAAYSCNVDTNSITFNNSALEIMRATSRKAFTEWKKNNLYGQYKKRYQGKYDLDSINSYIIEGVYRIYSGQLQDEPVLQNQIINCGEDIYKAIKYYLEKHINIENESNRHLDPEVFDPNNKIDSQDITIYEVVLDESDYRKYCYNKNKGSRLNKPYERVLEFISLNNVHLLFREDAHEIHTILEAIEDDETYQMYERECGEHNQRFYKLRPPSEVAKHIKTEYETDIQISNICRDLTVISQKIIDHLFLSLSYKLDDDNNLEELEEKHYIKIKDKEVPDFQKINEKYVSYYGWQTVQNDRESVISFKLYHKEETVKPKAIKISKENLIIYEDSTRYYVCNTESNECIALDKKKRILKGKTFEIYNEKAI